MQTEQKRQKEKVVVGHMVQLYCKKHHGTKGSLCPQCQALLDYAHQRSDRCPRMEAKTFCAHCPIHCYNKEKREQIQVIMRYAGPRMLFTHPLLTISHMLESYRERKERV